MLDQCFSTFLSLSLHCVILDQNYENRTAFTYFTRALTLPIWCFKIWQHTLTNSTAHLCNAAAWLRNTVPNRGQLFCRCKAFRVCLSSQLETSKGFGPTNHWQSFNYVFRRNCLFPQLSSFRVTPEPNWRKIETSFKCFSTKMMFRAFKEIFFAIFGVFSVMFSSSAILKSRMDNSNLTREVKHCIFFAMHEFHFDVCPLNLSFPRSMRLLRY